MNLHYYLLLGWLNRLRKRNLLSTPGYPKDWRLLITVRQQMKPTTHARRYLYTRACVIPLSYKRVLSHRAKKKKKISLQCKKTNSPSSLKSRECNQIAQLVSGWLISLLSCWMTAARCPRNAAKLGCPCRSLEKPDIETVTAAKRASCGFIQPAELWKLPMNSEKRQGLPIWAQVVLTQKCVIKRQERAVSRKRETLAVSREALPG